LVAAQRVAAQRAAERELRCHAEEIFHDYARRLHEWEPMKRTHDVSGSPHDVNARKCLHDAALLSFELFLYRLHGEQEVFTLMLMGSIDTARSARAWSNEEEGRVLHYLGITLRSHRCYASMLRERLPAGNEAPRCELMPLDMSRLSVQYNLVLNQAHLVDEALEKLQQDRSELVASVGMLALLWARWNLEAEDKFRQNEVLLIMSALIYNTVNVLETATRTMPDVPLDSFQPACEYFLLLLHVVEWPNTWKSPLIGRVQAIFPRATVPSNVRPSSPLSRNNGDSAGGNMGKVAEMKEAVLAHPLTQDQACIEASELRRPEPGQEFFDRHRRLYSWVMSGDEAIAQEYVLAQAPALRAADPASPLKGRAAH